MYDLRMREDIRNGEKPESPSFPRSPWREEEQICKCIPETVPDFRIWWMIREDDSGARTSRRSGSATTRRISSASQEMRRKKTQNPCEFTPTDPKQASIGIVTRDAIQKRKEKKFRRKHEEHSNKMSLGVNILQMTQAEMRNIKVRLADLFKTEINLIMREFEPRTNDWEDWQAFERAYEEALHLLRLHIVKILKRDEKKTDGFSKVNPTMQTTRAEHWEKLFAKQDIQRRLLKLKSKLEQFEEYQDESPAARGNG
jgi:hypothetical protein